MDFVEHPFWNYSLQLYARPGVADACLRLQDEFGLDVNLVLFCIWAGLEGTGELQPHELQEAVARAGRWQTEVVERIRFIRRTLKTDGLGASDELAAAFRPQAQRLELQAEHVEQLMLASLVPNARGAKGSDTARANLNAYLELAGIRPDLTEAPVQQILMQAFSDLKSGVK